MVCCRNGCCDSVLCPFDSTGSKRYTVSWRKPGDAFVLTLLAHGFKVAAIIGGVVTCIFVAAYIVWRARDRRKEEYEENIETAKRFA